MANLILTTECQRNCKFCFSKNDLRISEINEENFIKIIDFISTEHKFVNLVGGEPTIHKNFTEILEFLIINNFYIQVFTNGLISKENLEKIVKILNYNSIKKEHLYFSVNLSSGINKIQRNTLKKLNTLSYPSYTIQSKEDDLMFLVDTIRSYNLDPTIRLGLALPSIGSGNEYLPIEHYRSVAKNIINLTNNSEGITIKLDCGFPLCMFKFEELENLNKDENHFRFDCGQAIDIYPDLSVTNCFALKNIARENIEDFESLPQLKEHFYWGLMTPIGIYGDVCYECEYFGAKCSGGCKGFYRPEKGEKYVKDNLE